MQKDEFTRVTTFFYTLLTQNVSSRYQSYLCTITGAPPSKPTKNLFSPILQDVFITDSTCASHQPAAFCRLSLLLLVLFCVFNVLILTNKMPVVNDFLLECSYLKLRNQLLKSLRLIAQFLTGSSTLLRSS